MSDKKISILTDLRECVFGVDDFKTIFSEMEKHGEIYCLRFYNYVGGDAELDEFIAENGGEVLPKAVRTNDLDSRLVIDSVSLCKKEAQTVVLINVKDDDLLIEYLTALGSSVFAVKGGGVEQDVFELYDKVFVFFGTPGDEKVIRAVYEKIRIEESVDGGIAADLIDTDKGDGESYENIGENDVKNGENIDEKDLKNSENIDKNNGEKDGGNIYKNDGEVQAFEIQTDGIKANEVKTAEIKIGGKKKFVGHEYIDKDIIAIFDRLLKK
jgi:hypothetical protein